jgi:Flp pilus assembly protein TadG
MRVRRNFLRTESGASAVEFALLVPIMLLLLGQMLDFGFNLVMRFSVTQAVSASSNYAVVNGTSASASGGATLAQNLATLIPTAMDVAITVNNGPALTRTSGTSSTSGTASNADICYCPSISGSTITWGGSVTCGSTCATGGGFAGKYVLITGKQMYTPMFGVLGISKAGWISASSLVQVQ